MAAIALTLGKNQAKPKDAYALIFAIIAAFIFLMFLFQSRDLAAAEAADARATTSDPASIENPATLEEPVLWAAMAIQPIDADAVRARKQVWSSARESIRTAVLICILIFLTVPPIYLFDTFVPLVVGGPAIAGVALWKSVRLVALSGGLDQAYGNASRAMAPLGLAVTERPQVTVELKSVSPDRMGPALHGALVLQGERFGRAVTVRMPTTEGIRSVSEVRVTAATPDFELRSRDGRIKVDDGAPQVVRDAVKRVPNSVRWKGVHGGGSDGAISVERKGVKGGDWLLDLWLAERVADALSAR